MTEGEYLEAALERLRSELRHELARLEQYVKRLDNDLREVHRALGRLEVQPGGSRETPRPAPNGTRPGEDHASNRKAG